MKARIPITSPAFKYDDSANTDIRRRFARVRKELRAKADEQAREIAQREADTAKIVVGFEKRRQGKA